ncbi:methyltransferase family protein [Saccharopolyspora mangrovi]|uniref:Isoprenylcysteine carboxylmethyltransferase family protein n=1 Tax=Saccharopolyspora mangrovi TaxID=3082379 RepID=A0ABU6ACM5_9PSEU|nr:isoprenylcysteine carboxylmethyltransferase family protein [Saccharopolyspora sp. S2-29]MEB3369227.1 isoprenylcysteine carboxylmethyltransferase family protein [Saccharopolyspora sp. S2-29]
MYPEELIDARRRAAWGSAAFLVVGPGSVTGLVPWLLTRWRARRPVPGGVPAQLLGTAMILVGGAALTRSFAHFVIAGMGTPVPGAPPSKLVVTGVYRHVRNPMYGAMQLMIIGQALLLGQSRLYVWSSVAAALPAAYVPLREEPVLRERFGEEYDRYCRNVPRWLPRLRPWHQD